MHDHIYLEIAGVHVEFFVGSEGKAHVLALGVDGLADDNVGGGVDLEGSRDEELFVRMVGVDVIAAGNAER